jgi:hypothetical protein
MFEHIIIGIIVAVAILVVAKILVRSVSDRRKCSSCEACRLASSCDHIRSPASDNNAPAAQSVTSQK